MPVAPPMQGQVVPPRFNQDISKGPVMSELPAPYQPPPNQGANFDSSGFVQEAFRTLPLEVAMKASEAAIQLEGQLGYAADLKAGVPDMQALTKWAPKIWHRNPAVAAHLMNASKPAFQPSKINVQGQEMYMMSPNRAAFAPKGQRAELTPGEQIHALSQEMRGLEKQIAGESDLKREEALRQKYAAKVEELSALRGKSGGIRVREKKTGKIHRYAGNAADIPTDQFEILQ